MWQREKTEDKIYIYPLKLAPTYDQNSDQNPKRCGGSITTVKYNPWHQESKKN